MAAPLQPQTYSMDEVAALLGVGRTHCYELARRDELPVAVIRLGRRLVVRRAELDRFLAGPEPGEGRADARTRRVEVAALSPVRRRRLLRD